jgi:predicted nucleic acid-binding protein
MGFLARLFGTDPDSRVARARRLLERGEADEARREVEDIDRPDAIAVLEDARGRLVEMNLEEAIARIHSGDAEGAQEHMELALTFGATQGQLRDVRKAAREAAAAEKAQQEAEAAKQAVQLEGDDPLWSLPPDDPRLRYALLLESWPEDLRERLAALGPDYARAVMLLEDGNAAAAVEALSAFVEGEPAARFDRARALLGAGQPLRAASDLATFGDRVGHQVVGQTHTAVLLAQLWARHGRADAALEMLEAQTDGGLAIEGARVSLLEAMGRPADAIAAAEALLQRVPKDQGLYRVLARARMQTGDRAGAKGALEASLAKTCSSPGKCGNQPYDVQAARMLAVLYLEDQEQPTRVDALLDDLRSHAQEPAWEDGYIAGLVARNGGDLDEAGRIAQALVETLPQGDPRRDVITRSLSALPA